jgi:anti-anti-sigma factor
MNDLLIEIEPLTEGTLIRLVGEADVTSIDSLQASLLAISVQRPVLVVFDLAGLEFAASLFMGTLVSFRRGIVRNGGQVRLAALQSNVEEAFRIARLDDLFAMMATVEAALAP